MFLPDNLLNPIPGDNPSGESLRYAAVSKRDATYFYDKVKEARREEDDIGEYAQEGKKAEFDVVIKLCTDALASRSKDVQIAAWLTEALLKTERLAGFKEGLDLIRGLLETFWDTLYPELEDGDAELRIAPLDWVGHLGAAVKFLPFTEKKSGLTDAGYDWFQYKESGRIPTEEDAGSSDNKRQARKQAVQDNKVLPEQFEEVFGNTKKAFYKKLVADVEACIESVGSLDEVSKEKFGSDGPGFSKLQAELEEVHVAARTLLKKKLELDPDPVAVPEPPPPAEVAEAVTETLPASGAGPESAAPPAAAVVTASQGQPREPVDRADAVARLNAVANYLRQNEPLSPVAYLLLRALGWGELRNSGAEIDPRICEPPPTEVRQELKLASIEGRWQDVLGSAERAMGTPCGRSWLDLQRYAVKACSELGGDYQNVAVALRSELKALLADYPQLPEMELMDGTAAANRETLTWLAEEIVPPPPAPVEAETEAPKAEPLAPPVRESDEEREREGPDVYELAMQAASQGRAQEAIGMLAAAAAQERSGRERFQRKVQLAGICMATGNEPIAHPILEELSSELERRRLEEWESPENVAQPLALLYKCLVKLDRDAEERQKVYDRICRLDPSAALSCAK